MAARRVCVGAITGAHGVRGAVRIRAFTADPADVAAYRPVTDEGGSRVFEVAVVGETRGQIVARIAGVEDREAAEALKGTRLYVPREALPPPEEEEYYHADLIGLEAEAVDGTPVGTVRAVHDFGAGDVLEIVGGGEALMIPFTRSCVPVVDVAGGRLVVEVPEGLTPPRGRED